MSTLIVHECSPEVYQEITPSKNILLGAIRPHLYFHNVPSGTIQVRITDENGYQISATSSQNISDLIDAVEVEVGANAYIHSYVRFDIETPLMKDRTYRIYVTCGGGYMFMESAYVGVCKDWDNRKTDVDYSVTYDLNAPLDFELWERVKT